jgi:hypothetical protein
VSTIELDQGAERAAMRQARGRYQRAILRGEQRISGSDLRGEARRWSGRYAASVANLLERCAAAGIVCGEQRGVRGLRVLTLAFAEPVVFASLSAGVLTCATEDDASRFLAHLAPRLAEYDGALTLAREGAVLRFLGDAGAATDVVLDALDADATLPRVRLERAA